MLNSFKILQLITYIYHHRSQTWACFNLEPAPAARMQESTSTNYEELWSHVQNLHKNYSESVGTKTANMLNSFKIAHLITFFPPKNIKGKYFSQVNPLPAVLILNGGYYLVRWAGKRNIVRTFTISKHSEVCREPSKLVNWQKMKSEEDLVDPG